MFLLANFNFEGKISASTAPATDFVDLAGYGFEQISDITDVKDLLKLDNVEIWGPDADVIHNTISENDVEHFFSTTLHAGPGNGGDSTWRLTVFVVHTKSEDRHEYQEEEYQILAPEMLELFFNVGSGKVEKEEREREAERALELMKDWEIEVTRDSLIFNYQVETQSRNFNTENDTGVRILEMLDGPPSSDDDDASDREFVL